MSQADDIDAISDYFKRQTDVAAKYPDAVKLAQSFDNWYKNLSWFDKTMASATYDEARNRRDAFNMAIGAKNLKDLGYDTMTTEQMSATSVYTKMPVQPSKTSTGKSVIKLGSSGPDVITWQKIIGVTADGKFGPATVAKTKLWQQQQGITPDGIVGEISWTKALGMAPTTKPTPKPTGKPTGGTASKPGSQPIKPTPGTAPPKPKEAGIFSGVVNAFSKLPTWGKALLGATAASGIYVSTQKGHHKPHGGHHGGHHK